MNYWNIAVAHDYGHESMAEEVRARLVRAWKSRPEAKFRAIALAALDEELIRQFDAVVLIVDAYGRNPPILRPLSFLEELHIPTLALVDKSPEPRSVFEHTNVLIEDRSTPGGVLCARIHGLLHRQREINRLRREVAVASRSHDGLEHEVSRMHTDLQLAAQAQRGFLPGSLPTLHGITMASLWRPARYVSGDIYDVIRLDEDCLGLFLADAVGHGLAAALMTMVICQSLTTRVREGSSWRTLAPAEVLGRLNDTMIRRPNNSSRFATAVYAVMDCRSRRLTLSGAGHPPPILVHADGRLQFLNSSGGLLGVFTNEEYDQVEIDLAVGDRLLIYTDGFEQAFPRPDQDESRLHIPTKQYRQEFRKLCSLPGPQDMVEAIGRRLDVQTGSLHQVDDLTLLCVHAGPLAAAVKACETKSAAA